MVRVYIVEPNDKRGGDWTGEIWMHPSPECREPRPLVGLLSPRLIGDYQDAIEGFRHGLWRSAAQQARTVLEGIVKSLLSTQSSATSDRRLAVLLSDLATTTDLAKPITDVSTVLREGGNVASHFDEDREVDATLAGEMLDLLDAFIDYLMLLPRRVERLKQMLEKDTQTGS